MFGVIQVYLQEWIGCILMVHLKAFCFYRSDFFEYFGVSYISQIKIQLKVPCQVSNDAQILIERH